MISQRCNNKPGPLLRIYVRRFFVCLLNLRVYASRETSINKERYTECIRVVMVQAFVVKIYFFLRLFLSYRLRSRCFNNLNFPKTLACTVAFCFFATIYQRYHSSFVCDRNFAVFSKSNVIWMITCWQIWLHNTEVMKKFFLKQFKIIFVHCDVTAGANRFFHAVRVRFGFIKIQIIRFSSGSLFLIFKNSVQVRLRFGKNHVKTGS